VNDCYEVETGHRISKRSRPTSEDAHALSAAQAADLTERLKQSGLRNI